MWSFPIFAEERVIRLPRPSLIRRVLMPRFQQAPDEQERQLTPVMARYGIQPQGPVRVQGGGKRNEAWTVQTENGRLLLKRYKTTLTRAQIIHEHSILEHLELSAFPAPRLVRDRDGGTLVEIENRYYALFDYLTGYAHFDEYFYYPRQDGWLQKAVGSMLGQLHNALHRFAPRGENIHGFSSLIGKRDRDLDWYLSSLEQARKASTHKPPGDPLRVLLDAKGIWMGEQLQLVSGAIETANPERGLIHGDYGPNNMLFKSGAPPVVLDFELARTDWLLVDVVAALSTSCAREGTRAEWQRILRGYLAERPIPVEQLHLLPQIWQFQALRRAITCCERYAAQPDPALLKEAARRIRRAEWAGLHQAELASLAKLAENRPAPLPLPAA